MNINPFSILAILLATASASVAQIQPVKTKPTALWVKDDGTVEAQAVVEESATSYLLEVPNSPAKIGIPKEKIIFFSASPDWISFLTEILADSAESTAIFDKIAANYERRPETLYALPAGIGVVLEQPNIFNQLPERLRKILLRRAAQESTDMGAIQKGTIASIAKVKSEIEAEAKNQPEAMESAAKETKNFPATALAGPSSMVVDKYSSAQKAQLMTQARAKAREIVLVKTLGSLNEAIALLQIAGASDIIHEFEQKGVKPAFGAGLPPMNTEVINSYRTMLFTSLLAGNLPAHELSIIMPELRKQDIFQTDTGAAKMINAPEFGLFQITDVEGLGIFLKSNAISPEESLNTQTLLLTDVTEPMKVFFTSDAAKSGNFIMTAALKEPEVETIGDISFVRAVPLLVLTREETGELKPLYATAEIAAQSASTKAFSESLTQAATTPQAVEDTPQGETKVAGESRDISGRWQVNTGSGSVKIEVQSDGYSTDQAYRLRDLSGIVLLRSPEDTWTLSWEVDGSLRGKSDIGSEVITLRRY